MLGFAVRSTPAYINLIAVGWVERVAKPSFKKQIMRTYIREKSKGGLYFFTVNLNKRKNNDLLISNIEILREAFRYTKTNHPFIIDAIVILPEHLHCIWKLPDGDNDFSTRWRLIKSYFSRHIPKNETISKSRKLKGERAIWQRRFWEHLIQNEQDYQRHLDYIHFNPVKHGYVEKAVDWPYSSFHLWTEKGVYPRNWGANIDVVNLDFE